MNRIWRRLRDLLRFDGRLSRIGFWRGYLWLGIAGALAWVIGLAALLSLGRWGAVFLIPMAPLVVASIAIIVRRLHDRNRTGLWALAFVLYPTLLGLWLSNERQDTRPTLLVAVLWLAAFVLNIWGLIEIGFRRGKRGPNRFGEEPA